MPPSTPTHYPNFLSKWAYYLRSIPTLLFGLDDPLRTFKVFLASLPPKEFFWVRVRNADLKFKVRTKIDLWIIKESCLDRDYERLTPPINEGWVIVDVGAAFGDFSLSVAKRFPRARVVAFEPHPSSYKLLEENRSANNIANIELHNVAVTSDPTVTTLTIPLASDPGNFFVSNSQTSTNGIEVQCVQFEEILRSLGHVDFLKMDCEGAEYDILMKLSPQSLTRIKRVALEYHDEVTRFSHQDLKEFFEKSGYTVTIQRSPVHPEIGFLFAHQKDLNE